MMRPVSRHDRPSRRAQRQAGAATLLLTPFFLLFSVVLAAPIGYALYLSLWTQQSSGLGFGGTHQAFTGIGNYARALSDPSFRNGFLVIVAYGLIYVPLMLGTALTLALLIDSTLARARRFFQLALFLPHAVPGVIAALVWVYLYTPGISPLITALDKSGARVDFLAPAGVLPSTVNIAVWEWTGYNMVIFYAALQAIPREVLEAATIDGASGIRVSWSVKLPLIRPSLVLTALFTVIGSLQLFTEPMILHRSSASVVSTWTPNMYAYTAAFQLNDYGVAAAASVLLAVTAAALSFVVTRAGARRSTATLGRVGRRALA